MLRRISLIAASAAMVALSALPASAANMQSSTHRLAFPGLHGVRAWGTYVKTGRGVRVHVCVGDMSRRVYAAGDVVEVSNAARTRHANLGAVAFGYHQRICRQMTLRYSAHMQIYTFTANNRGMINHRSRIKNVY